MIQMTKRFVCLKIILLLMLTACAGGREDIHVIQSVAMRPTFEPGDKVEIFPIENGNLKRFDMVLVDAPVINIKYVFRIIGVPGDTMKLTAEGLLVNGNIVPNPKQIDYSISSIFPNDDYGVEREVKIEANEYFVIGDNMKQSRDSRTFGLVPRDRILGKVTR